jgi:cysteine-rich repeat protein
MRAYGLALFPMIVLSNACSSGNTEGQGVCGNRMLEVGEFCDDGNTHNGDGCSNDCRIETAANPDARPR